MRKKCIIVISIILTCISTSDYAYAHRYYIGGQASLRYEDYLADYGSTSSYTYGFGSALGLNFATYIYDPRLAVFSSGLTINNINYTTDSKGLRRYSIGYNVKTTLLPDRSPLLFYLKNVYNEQDTGTGYLLRLKTFSYGLNWSIAINRLPRIGIILDKTRNEVSGVPSVYKEDRLTSEVSFMKTDRDNILSGQYQYLGTNNLTTNNSYITKGLVINNTKIFRRTLRLDSGLSTYSFAYVYPSETTVSSNQFNIYTNLVNTQNRRVTTNYFINYNTAHYSKENSTSTQAGYNLYFRATPTISILNGIYIIDSRSTSDAGNNTNNTEYIQGGIRYLKPWKRYYVNAGYNIAAAIVRNTPGADGFAHSHYFDGGIGTKDFKFFNVYNDASYTVTKHTTGVGNDLDSFRYYAQLNSIYFKPVSLQSHFTYERKYQTGFPGQYPLYNRLFDLICSLPIMRVGLFSLTAGLLNNSTPHAWNRNQYIASTLGITSIRNTGINMVLQKGFNSSSSYPSSDYTRYELYFTHNYRMLFFNIRGYLIIQHIPGASSIIHGFTIQMGRNFGGYVGE